MNKLSIARIFALAGSALFALLFFASTANAIGQISTPIVIPDALRGQEVAVDLSFVNSDNISGKFKLSAGGQIASWAYFYTAADRQTPLTGEFVIPAGSRMEAVAVFKIPADVANGLYIGAVNIETVPVADTESNKEKTNITVEQMISREVTITVTDKENIAASVSIIPLKYTLSPKEAFGLSINVRNEGNIIIKPSVHLNISADKNQVIDVIYPYPAAKDGIKPGTTVTLDPVQWKPIDGKNGNYVAKVDVLVNDSNVGNAVIPFEFVAENDLFLANIKKFTNDNVLPIAIAALFVFGIFIIAILKFTKFFSRAKKNNPIL